MASRDLSAGMLAAIAAATVRPALFYEGEFASSQFLRLWTGVGTISWDGKTWTGGGNLLAISPIEETIGVQAVGFAITLSGMPSATVALALASVRQGKPGRVWLGLYDASWALITDPYELRRGKMDVTVIEDNGETCTISAQYEDRLVDLERPRVRRYTGEDQARDYPSDLGFAQVPALQEASFAGWGGPGAAGSVPAGGQVLTIET